MSFLSFFIVLVLSGVAIAIALDLYAKSKGLPTYPEIYAEARKEMDLMLNRRENS